MSVRWFLLLGVVALACGKAKAGDKCEESGLRVCVDGKTSLYCAKGAWQADTCRGPKGCVEAGKIVTCDVTGNAAGDVCPAALEGFQSCAADGKSRVECKGGKYVMEVCKGKDGCTLVQAGPVTCDQGPPDIGGSCKIEKLQACSPDKKSAMHCQSGAFALAQKCPGPNGCSPQGGGLVSCDPNGVFVEGDLCHFISVTCTKDGRTQLECDQGKLKLGRACPGEGGCAPGVCDPGVAKVGEQCKEGGRACADDKKALVECKDKNGLPVWTVTKKCGNCEPKDGKLECK